jgi:hypothetical protein
MTFAEYVQGSLTEEELQRVQRQVVQWETITRRSLEASCGHSVDASSLFPHLKFAATCGPRTPASCAVGVRVNGSCGKASYKAADDRSSRIGEASPQEGFDGVESAAQRTPGQVPEMASTVEVDSVCAVRVFLVAQEPVGRLPPFVHVHLEVEDVPGVCQ